MQPPRTAQNGSRNQPRTSSSKPTKNISKPRCEAWVPLNGWEQSDDAESDIFYLAIDSWAKRNSKIKTDAPKGVPSSKLWEPFLCTTDHQCSGILDFKAFVNVSLSLHKDIEVEKEDCLQDEKTNLRKDSDQTSRVDSNNNTSSGSKIDGDKIQAEQPKRENGQSDKKESDSDKKTHDHSDKKTHDNSDEKGNDHSNRNGNDHSNRKGNDHSNRKGNDHSEKKQTDHSDHSEKKESGHSDIPIIILPDAEKVRQKDNRSAEHLDIVTHGPTPAEGGDIGELDNEDILDWMARNGTSHSAPVSRTHQREPLKKRGRSAKTKSAEDRLRRAALKNATKSKVNSKKVSVPVSPVKISYMHSGGQARAGIFAGEHPMSEAVDNTESGVSESTPSESPISDAASRTSLEHRLLIEEVIKENSKKIEYMPTTSVVSIGDLLSSAPHLERRQGQHSNGRDSMYGPIANEDDGTSSRESFGTWSSPRPSQDLRSPSSSSLPPVPVTTKHSTPSREIHSSKSPRSEGRKTVNLNSAKIPVISYRKGARRDAEDNGDVGRNLDDTRYIKYNDSIMSAIQETTVELDKELTNRLLKSALARDKSRVHSAGYIRQLQVDCDRDKDRILSQVLGKHRFLKRGPPAFRPQNFKTPLQRAVENAHKKMYGQHYYLFNNNSGATGMENVEDMKNGIDSAKGLRTQSANGETTNAYVWKENIESQQRHKRKANATSVQIGELHDIRWHSTTPQTNWSSVVEHYITHSLDSDYSGTEKTRAKTKNANGGYKVSDFKPNFKVDTLKTDRRKTIQR